MVTTLGTMFAEEVVTMLVYLEITSIDSVEYSGLMIDGERIVGMQKAACIYGLLTIDNRRFFC